SKSPSFEPQSPQPLQPATAWYPGAFVVQLQAGRPGALRSDRAGSLDAMQALAAEQVYPQAPCPQGAAAELPSGSTQHLTLSAGRVQPLDVLHSAALNLPVAGANARWDAVLQCRAAEDALAMDASSPQGVNYDDPDPRSNGQEDIDWNQF